MVSASRSPPATARLDQIHLRYARWDFSRVDLIDARTGQILCPVRPLDKAANADALRRRVDPATTRHERDAGRRHRAAAEANDRRLRRHRLAARLFTHRREGRSCMNQKLLALYGLKWNPFTPEVPIEALYVPPKVENFCWRIEQAHLREGGFALDPRRSRHRQKRRHAPARRAARRAWPTSRSASSIIRRATSPTSIASSAISSPSPSASATAGAALRRCAPAGSITWVPPARRPVVLVDEAQEMTPMVLSELRLLASARFDSQSLLCVVLIGRCAAPR